MNVPEEFLLTDEKFNAFVRDHAQHTISYLTEHPTESLMPELVVMTRTLEGKDELTLCALAVPFDEDMEKRSAIYNLGKKFYAEEKVTLAVMLVSEAWMSQRTPEQMSGKAPHVEPRHDPNRKEHIIVVGSGLQGHQRLFITTPVRRDEKNNMIVDGESKEIAAAKFPLIEWFWRGFFDTLLPR